MRPNRFYKNMNRSLANEIRDLYFNRIFKQNELANIYGISQSAVCRTISGVSW